MSKLNKKQIDRLGDRLKAGPPAVDDLILLDEYRRSFGEAQESLLSLVRSMGLTATGRPAKSTGAIVAKLRRESAMKLSQIQDIAGCRIEARDLLEQDRIVEALRAGAFPAAKIRDRREKPSHGYRAVHVILAFEGKRVEVQVRTTLQHQWAIFSEKCSDNIDSGLKYGEGPGEVRELLGFASGLVANFERVERKQAESEREQADWERDLAELARPPGEEAAKLDQLRAAIEGFRASLDNRRASIEEVRALLLKGLKGLMPLLDAPRADRIKWLGEVSDYFRGREGGKE